MQKKTRFMIPVLLQALLAVSVQAREDLQQLRVDCRYHLGKERFCYSSASYEVNEDRELRHIRFGVGCDQQTIYDNQGTSLPQAVTSDSIRPWTAATPRIELIPQAALRSPGAYLSKLETEDGIIHGGICYVKEARDRSGGISWKSPFGW